MRCVHPSVLPLLTWPALALSGAMLLAGCGSDSSSTSATSATASTSTSTSATAEASPTPSSTATTSSSPSSTSAVPGSALPTQQPEGYSIALTTSAGTSYVTVEAVQALRQVTIDTPDAGMPQQSGAPLREVLTAAGVTAFESATITGPNGSSTVAANSIDDTVILGVSKRQTVRFSGQSVPTDQWVQDVTGIEVS